MSRSSSDASSYPVDSLTLNFAIVRGILKPNGKISKIRVKYQVWVVAFCRYHSESTTTPTRIQHRLHSHTRVAQETAIWYPVWGKWYSSRSTAVGTPEEYASRFVTINYGFTRFKTVFLSRYLSVLTTSTVDGDFVAASSFSLSSLSFICMFCWACTFVSEPRALAGPDLLLADSPS